MIEAIAGTPAAFAECPVWLPGPQCLFWVDCAAGCLWSLDWRSRRVRSVLSFPGTLFSGLVRHDESRLVLLTGAGAFSVDPEGRTAPFPMPEAIDVGLINDGKTDPTGRLWVGQVRSAPGKADGVLHRLSASAAEPAAIGLGIPNGPAFDHVGGVVYFADSLAGAVDSGVPDMSGTLGTRRRILTLPAAAGQPDGMTVDADGQILVAIFDGGGLLRIDPATLLAERIPMPVRRPTSCTFGGPDLRTLFVTVANGPWPRDRRRPEPPPAPDLGPVSIYAISMEVPGVPEPDIWVAGGGDRSIKENRA